MSSNGQTVTFTVSFGYDNSLTITRPVGTKFKDIFTDPEIQSELGFGSNVQATVGNVPQPADGTIREGDLVSLSTVANTKA